MNDEERLKMMGENLAHRIDNLGTISGSPRATVQAIELFVREVIRDELKRVADQANEVRNERS